MKVIFVKGFCNHSIGLFSLFRMKALTKKGNFYLVKIGKDPDPVLFRGSDPDLGKTHPDSQLWLELRYYEYDFSIVMWSNAFKISKINIIK